MNEKCDYYFAKGTEYYEQGKLQKALRFLLKSEKIEAGYSSLNIGNVYVDYSYCQGNKNRKKAIQWFKKSIKLKHYAAMNNIADIYIKSYNYKKAKKWLKKSIKYGDNETSYELAKLYLMEGKIKKAIKLLEIFKGDRLKLNISEGCQEDALKLLKTIKDNLTRPEIGEIGDVS